MTVLPALAIVILLTAWLFSSRSRRGRLPLPPGPKGLPLIGNLLDFPAKFQWLTFDKWHEQYGDIVYLNLAGQSLVILGSPEATSAFFDQKSGVYSDRPRFVMVNELIGWEEFNVASYPYGNAWRELRRVFHQQYHSGVIPRYYPIFRRHAHRLLRNLLAQPKDIEHHLLHTASAIILDTMYGIDVVDRDDPYVTIADKAMEAIVEAANPGSFLVDSFPALKYVPSWFPGAEFQRKAIRWKALMKDMLNKPFQVVKDGMQQGRAMSSIAATMLQEVSPDDEEHGEYVIKAVGAASYAAGSDTTSATTQVFALAMAMHPEVQARAQAELDAVVGPNRLPDFDDRPNLPYVNAIVRELARWLPVVPLAVPHAASEDDEVRGYFIPKGTIILGNTWSILRDPVRYPDPDQFKPERFLTKDGKLATDVQDPSIAAFGYGRRICPGRHFSDGSVYSLVSCMLATFSISPPIGEDGAPIKITAEMSAGAVLRPARVDYIVKPRSDAAVELIRNTAYDA
ncbi:cytochrome P450 [Heliocybe sulcata]|uniref:Cytochrome P450 n=1 Tax=Heliocybe sulcata TaxID=5364 RepID=A0A5C3MT81_9AGAM|nr:cytochrome P450 [Heliocybe sulcata]